MISRAFPVLASVLLAASVFSGPAFATETSHAQSDAASAVAPPNLSGTWKLDRSRSESPRNAMGSARGEHGSRRSASWSGANGEGGEGGSGAWSKAGSSGSQSMHRPARLPDLFTLVQSADSIVLRDSTDAVVRTFTVADKMEANDAGAEQLHGAWKGQDFVVETKGPRGTTRETYELADAGQTLKITTHVEPGGDRKPFDMTRVYTKVSG
jgi:hypothetical protein